LVKYWGKTDSKQIIPANDSFSITVSKKALCSRTTITLDPIKKGVSLELNGKVSEVTERIKHVIEMISERAPVDLKSHGIKIVSENNFNTAAGLASSASGLSCLAFALIKVYGIEVSREEISMYARLGSGSACRSLDGGFV
jgi:diphosphomevalonate decarboxylase